MTAQRRPGRPAPAGEGRLLLEVHPDHQELVADAVYRELDGVPVDLVVTADLPAGTAVRFTLTAEFVEFLRAQAEADR